MNKCFQDLYFSLDSFGRHNKTPSTEYAVGFTRVLCGHVFVLMFYFKLLQIIRFFSFFLKFIYSTLSFYCVEKVFDILSRQVARYLINKSADAVSPCNELIYVLQKLSCFRDIHRGLFCRSNDNMCMQFMCSTSLRCQITCLFLQS